MSSRTSTEGEWKAATDSKSGRVYYYHTKTKATTWTKPLELAGPEERKLMIEMKEKTLKFFREMEQNIRDKIVRARLIDEDNLKNRSNSGIEDDDGYYCLDERGSFIHDNTNNRTQIPGFDAVTKFRLSSFSRGTSGSGDFGNNSARDRDSPHMHRDSIDYGSFDPKLANRARKNSSSGLGMGPPRRIRTISTMDDEILLTMRRNAGGVSAVEGGPGVGDRRSAYYNVPVGSNSIGISGNSATTVRSRDPFLDAKAEEKDKFGGPSNLMRDTSKEIGDRVDHLYPTRPAAVNPQYLVDHMNTSVNAPGKRSLHGAHHDCNKCTRLRRRNSTGTIFLSHTMSNQDNAATIECVCVVIRAHMLDAAKENVVPLPEYDIFKDASYQTPSRAGRGRSGSIAASVPPAADHKSAGSAVANVPSLSTVKDFFMYVFSKSQLESDTIIMALIYCERLVKETKGKLCIRYDNWRSILFACLVMASKVWDDLSMWNVDFSQVYPSFDLRRVNTLELAMLDALKYVIRVSASEYAKYYFHLRSMMSRLGLNNTTGEPQLLKPLDIIGARKLQLSTQQYLEQHGASAETSRRRFYSVHETGSNTNMDGTHSSTSNKQPKNTVGLEQLVRADHMDADGQKHIGKNASFKGTEKKNKTANKLSTVTEVK